MTTIQQPHVTPSIPRSGKPRLKDIASIANISVATASMALADHPRVNDDTKRRVREIGKQIGYRTRPRYENQQPRRFGLMIVGGLVQDSVNAPLLMHLSQAGYANSVRFEYAATPPDFDHDEMLDRTLEFAQDLDAVLLVGCVTSALLEALASKGVTAIVLGDVQGHVSQPVDATVVTFDTLGMGYLATQRLLEQGHKRVAFACEYLIPGLSHERWLKGYRLAHAEAGVSLDPQLVYITGQCDIGLESAAIAFTKLDNIPTGFVVPDARLSASLVEHMAKLGSPIAQHALYFDVVADNQLPPELVDRPHFQVNITTLAQEAILRLIEACRNTQTNALHINIPFKCLNLI